MISSISASSSGVRKRISLVPSATGSLSAFSGVQAMVGSSDTGCSALASVGLASSGGWAAGSGSCAGSGTGAATGSITLVGSSAGDPAGFAGSASAGVSGRFGGSEGFGGSSAFASGRFSSLGTAFSTIKGVFSSVSGGTGFFPDLVRFPWKPPNNFICRLLLYKEKRAPPAWRDEGSSSALPNDANCF